MSLGNLLTARQVVEQLDRLGLGVWGPDVVIKWTGEEPGLPIALRAHQGKPHRYRLVDVLEFHLQRGRKERAKGFASGDAGLEARIERALQLLVAGDASAMPPATATAPAAASPGSLPQLVELPSTPGVTEARVSTDSAPTLPPAKAEAEPQQLAWDQLSESEALLAVLQGRDPRNWKAAEEAVKMRRNRLVEERRLIPVDELQDALDAHTEYTRTTILAAGPSMKLQLRDLVPMEIREKMDRAVEDAFQRLLTTLSGTSDIDDADGVTAAPPKS